MRFLRTLCIGSFVGSVAVVSGCATVSQQESANTQDVEKPTLPLVIGSGGSGLPTEASQTGAVTAFSGEALVPAGTLLVSQVSRKRSEMREGPGVNFALTDRILEKHTRVIVFERHGVWAKVLSIGYWDSGWVHVDTITPPKLNKSAVTINVGKFPTVLAVKPVNQALAFVDGSPVQLSEAIPRGKMFRALQVTDEKTLIWNSEKNEMIWIKGKDMQ